MNKLLCSALVTAMLVLPTAAFAQSIVQVDETQVEVIAYEDAGLDSAAAQAHTNPMSNDISTHASKSSETAFNPAADQGLNSIYLRH